MKQALKYFIALVLDSLLHVRIIHKKMLSILIYQKNESSAKETFILRQKRN